MSKKPSNIVRVAIALFAVVLGTLGGLNLLDPNLFRKKLSPETFAPQLAAPPQPVTVLTESAVSKPSPTDIPSLSTRSPNEVPVALEAAEAGTPASQLQVYWMKSERQIQAPLLTEQLCKSENLVLRNNLGRGEFLLRSRFVDKAEFRGFAATSAGMRLVAVKVSALAGAQGYLEPGGYVAVVIRDGDWSKGTGSLEIRCQRCRLKSYGAGKTPPVNGAFGARIAYGTATIEVPAEMADKILEFGEQNAVYLLPIADGDLTVAAKSRLVQSEYQYSRLEKNRGKVCIESSAAYTVDGVTKGRVIKCDGEEIDPYSALVEPGKVQLIEDDIKKETMP